MWSPDPEFQLTSQRTVGCPIQLLLRTTPALCRSRDLADASPRYTAEMRSVRTSSAVEEKEVQVCGRTFHIVRSAKGAYLLPPASCRALSIWKPV